MRESDYSIATVKMKPSIISDLDKAIRTASPRKTPAPDRKFHKHDQYRCYGLKTQDFRDIMKSFKPRFLSLPFAGRLELAEKLLSRDIGEHGHAGIYVLGLSAEELEPCHFPLLERLMNYFRSWSHVDHICGTVLQPLLLRIPKETLGFLAKLNSSPNRFLRRASVVTFVRNIAFTGRFTAPMLNLCENLVFDEEDIVRKGVGWALKDNLRSAKERVLPYIKELRRRGVSSTITLYAIRDLKGRERKDVLAVKKAGN